MQQLRLKQKLLHKITPQQIQLIKLLQVPAIDIRQRIEKELADNPVLEVLPEKEPDANEVQGENGDMETHDMLTNVAAERDDYIGPKFRNYNAEAKRAQREAAIPNTYSLQDSLLEQLDMLQLDPKLDSIGKYLIGSIEKDGYIRRDFAALVNDLLLTQYIETNTQEIATVLQLIQRFDPPGIGAKNLQECLLIQLQKQPPQPAVDTAIQIISKAFEAFTKKHYTQIEKKLGITDPQLLKQAIAIITKLNPKPGSNMSSEGQQNRILYPDFMVIKQDDQLEVQLNTYYTPSFRIRKSYLDILEQSQQTAKASPQKQALQEATVFVKQKVGAAKWFIEALQQRQQTLLHTMQAIVELQYNFFMTGDASLLQPMILKDVGNIINADRSTISRIVNNKSVQTNFGIYPLKFFFTEGISTTTGEDVSNKAVRQALEALIQQEDKTQPYPDEELQRQLVQQGYQVARRTVAKYREQLRIPVARLRKEVCDTRENYDGKKV